MVETYLVLNDLDEFEALHEKLKDDLAFGPFGLRGPDGKGRIGFFSHNGEPAPDEGRSTGCLSPMANFDETDPRLACRIDHLPDGIDVDEFDAATQRDQAQIEAMDFAWTVRATGADGEETVESAKDGTVKDYNPAKMEVGQRPEPPELPQNDPRREKPEQAGNGNQGQGNGNN